MGAGLVASVIGAAVRQGQAAHALADGSDSRVHGTDRLGGLYRDVDPAELPAWLNRSKYVS